MDNDEDLSKHISPSDFDKFLPWACLQLQQPYVIMITRIQQQDYQSTDRSKQKGKSKTKIVSPTNVSSMYDADHKESEYASDDIIHVQTVYNYTDHLVEIIISKNTTVPRIVLKIIGLAVKFHQQLTSVVINKGINEYTTYELCKFLPLSYITDICLDGTYLKYVNYHLLLEHENFVRNLSLSRCSIDDVEATMIADLLLYPLPASKTLSILNLSSNKITNLGAMAIANALRSNRQLSYLNLSGNMISDEGVVAILNVFLSFPLTFAELLASRARHILYLKEKNERVVMAAKALRLEDSAKRSAKPKLPKSPAKKGKAVEKEPSLKTLDEGRNSLLLNAYIEKAKALVENTFGKFDDPFNKIHTFAQDGISYCLGNNSLCYLSLAYNNWSYCNLKSILAVLLYQKKMFRKPGLVNLCIEGNLLPEQCEDLLNIDYHINHYLSKQQQRETFTAKKKTLTKTK